MTSDQLVLVWLLIEAEGALLLGRRKADLPPFAAQWTPPGDLMRAEESAVETIGRFSGEQLDISVVDFEFASTVYLREGSDYAVNLFRVTSYEGSPRFRASGPYEEVRWVAPADLKIENDYPMPAALRQALVSTGEGSPQ